MMERLASNSSLLSTSSSTRRFSLYLLDPDESYLTDYAAQLHLPQDMISTLDKSGKSVLKGRVKFCSKSIFFEPNDHAVPLIRFAYADLTAIQLMTLENTSKLISETPSPQLSSRPFCLMTSKVTTMKAYGRIGPYETMTLPSNSAFQIDLKYTSEPLETLLNRIRSLMAAQSLPTMQRQSRTMALVQEYERTYQQPFDLSWLEFKESIVLECMGGRVIPLLNYQGRLVLTDQRLLFQPSANVHSEPLEKYRLQTIVRILPRIYNLRPIGLEVYFMEPKHGQRASSVFFSFRTQADRELFMKELQRHCGSQFGATNNQSLETWTLKWQRHEISNYDYLMLINSFADRTVNDMARYPIFPWIIADYTSDVLDLTKESTFRDLSRPIGALNPKRLEMYIERFHEMPEPKFHYATHYSTPAYVLYYLVRSVPELMLCLQGGKFDTPDRLFFSMEHTWRGVLANQADVKELIPEFYEPPGDLDFLTNSMELELGIRQGGEHVGDVILPPWAKDATDFHRKMMQALECEFVSQRLHLWIDLIFGYKQRGVEAVKACNVFHPMSLWGGQVDLDSLSPEDRVSIEIQVKEFGQMPKQLWTEPHPQKLISTVQTSTAEAAVAVPRTMTMTPLRENVRIHRDSITAVVADVKNVYAVSKDGFLKVYSTRLDCVIRTFNVSDLPLSSIQLVSSSGTQESQYAVMACSDCHVYVYSLEYGSLYGKHPVHDDEVTTLLVFDHEGSRYMVTGSKDASIRIWTWPGLEDELPPELKHVIECDGVVLALCPLNSGFAAVVADGHISAYALTGEVLWQSRAFLMGDETPEVMLKLGPGSSCLLFGLRTTKTTETTKFVKMFDALNGRERAQVRLSFALQGAAWCEDVLASLDSESGVQFWDTSGRPVVGGISASVHDAQCVDMLMQRGKQDLLVIAYVDGRLSLYVLNAE